MLLPNIANCGSDNCNQKHTVAGAVHCCNACNMLRKTAI